MSTVPSDTVQGTTCPSCGAHYANSEQQHVCAVNGTGATVDSTTKPMSSTDQPGELVGTIVNERYQVLSPLGQGGMGAVYKARHMVLDSTVAIKVLLAPPDESVRKRFLQEARLASQVRHPNTVYISDFGLLSDQRPYLIMEYIQGDTLGKLSQSGPIPLLRALRLAIQICRGLRAVHDRGIVHRDLKPDNIFVIKDLGDSELVKIVDFGIATQASGFGSSAQVSATLATASAEPALTQVGALIGTPAYMAPEQIMAERLDQRVDQYALGCVLYEMFTGALPFNGTTLNHILSQHLRETVQPMRQRVPRLDLPVDLDALVARLLAKTPAGRLSSMAAVESELVRILGRVAPSAKALLPKERRRRWLLRGGAVALTCVLFAGGIYAAFRFGGRATAVYATPLQPGELQALRGGALEVTQWFLGSPLVERRLAAVAAIGQTHDEATLPLLFPLLTDKEPAVQAQAAEVVGQIGEPTAVSALVPLLASGKPTMVAAAASVALDKLGDPRGRARLGQLLDSKDPEAQFRAALALCQRGESAAAERLRSLVSTLSPPEELKQTALACLALRGDEAARASLHDKLHGPLHAKLKIDTAGILMQIGDGEARQFLLDLSRTPGPEQSLADRFLAGPDQEALLKRFRQVLADPRAQEAARALAAEALGAGGELLDVRRLVPHLREDSDELCLASAGALLQLAASDPSLLSTQSRHFVATAWTAKDWSVRQAAAAVLGDAVAMDDALAKLVHLQGDQDARVRRSAARALGRRGEYAALQALHTSLGDSDATVRSEALTAMARLAQTLVRQGQKRVKETLAPWLAELLTHAPLTEEAQARAVLLQLGDKAERERLRAIQDQAPPAVRLVLVENLGGDVELLLHGLADTDFTVRLAAAHALALRGDKRAVTVLKEALELGGPAALLAFGLLRRLGQSDLPPVGLERALQDKDPVVRTQAVRAALTLPLTQALSVLRRAAQDIDPAVRQTAAEVAAELRDGPSPQLPGTVILRLLLTDADAAVRARAAALLAASTLSTPAGSHLLDSPAPASPAAPAVAPRVSSTVPQSAPAAAAVVDGGTPADAQPIEAKEVEPAAVEGSLIFEGTPGTPVQIDKAPWSTLGKQAVMLPAGAHKVSYLDGTLTVEISSDKPTRAVIPPSPVERLATSGQELGKRRDFGKAQKQLERAGQLCTRDRRYAVLCAGVRPAISLALGRAYEGQDRPAEAMSEYEKVVNAAEAKGVTTDKASAQDAVKRLEGQLGQVLVPRQGKDGCVYDKIWMPPGTHTVDVEGQRTAVTVRARGVAKVGECK